MLYSYKNMNPVTGKNVFIEDSARIIGDVTLGDDASVWFNVVIRGDVHHIRIGARTNVQDGAVIHVTHDTQPTHIGSDVTIGHNATLHGCTVEERCLIGMGAIILDGACIGHDSLVAAGALVAPRTVIPPRSLVVGNPARVRRELTAEEVLSLQESADNYVRYKESY